jgi:hypothetical protein
LTTLLRTAQPGGIARPKELTYIALGDSEMVASPMTPMDPL